MIVVDASAVLEVLLRMPTAESIERRLFAPAENLNAPHLIDVEVVHVLRRYSASGALTPARGRAALADFLDLPLARYSHDLFLPRIWQLRNNLSAYDATYIALAEALRAPLITRDTRLAAAPGHYAVVELL